MSQAQTLPYPNSSAPDLPPGTDWAQVARALAAEFRATVVERERNDIRPLAEIERLRQTRLVNLLIPRRFGGEGGTISDAANVIREISKADGSLGFLLNFHYAQSSTARQIDTDTEGERFERLSAENLWFWGNVLGPFHITGTPTDDGGLIGSGTKHMCSGASLGDVLKIMGKRADRDEMFFAAIPADRAGIEIIADWDALGLRATETHSVRLNDVVIRPEEIIRSTGGVTGFASLASFGVFSAAFNLGILEGALDETRLYLQNTPSNPRPLGGNFDLPTQDPFIQLEYGKFWLRLQALQALFDQQLREADRNWAERASLTPTAREASRRRDTALQLLAAEAALDFSAKLFELTGGRSLDKKHGLDRFWRDIRSYTVHHPTTYMIKGIGAWALGATPPPPAIFDVRRRYEARQAEAAE